MAPSSDPKDVLHRYLDAARDALVWKLEGLGEYDIRRPMTPTGNNLLGTVKHLAAVEFGYFGDTFGRPGPEFPWLSEGSGLNADMYATADESRDEILDLYAQARAHADTTIEALDLGSTGIVPWWGPDVQVTLQWILVHVIAEVNRHLGQADIIRETIDGAVGHRRDNDNMPPADEAFWTGYVDRLEAIAREVGGDNA
ncbi:MAG: DinB family protein [Actinomycetota bacterium]